MKTISRKSNIWVSGSFKGGFGLYGGGVGGGGLSRLRSCRGSERWVMLAVAIWNDARLDASAGKR